MTSKAQLQIYAAQHSTLLLQIPQLRSCRSTLAHFGEQLQGKPGEGLRYAGQHIFVLHGLDTLAELSGGAVRDLEEQCYLAAESLARVTMVQAINLIYVLVDAQADHLTAAFRHHLDSQQQRAEAWHAFTRQMGDEEDQRQAQAQRDYVASQQCNAPWYATAPTWPALAQRAEAVGLGAQHHYLTARAADTEQAVVEQAFDILRCEQAPAAERNAAHQARQIGHASNAVFLAAYALWFYANALNLVARSVGDVAATIAVESVVEQLNPLIEAHEQLDVQHRQGKVDSKLYWALKM